LFFKRTGPARRLGILSTIYVTVAEQQAVRTSRLLPQFYAGRPLVRTGLAGTLPELQHVAHTNLLRHLIRASTTLDPACSSSRASNNLGKARRPVRQNSTHMRE